MEIGCAHASVAQLVEQGTENPRVVGSIPTGGTTHADLAHLAERHLAKVEVASSSLVIRSSVNFVAGILAAFLLTILPLCSADISGFSSPGRAPPSQGGGSEFESRNPLQCQFRRGNARGVFVNDTAALFG